MLGGQFAEPLRTHAVDLQRSGGRNADGIDPFRVQDVLEAFLLRRAEPDVTARVLLDEIGHRRVGQQLSLPDHDQMLGGERHFAHEVGRNEDRPPFRRKTLHEIPDPENSFRVQAVDGFVEHQDLRVTEQRGGDAEPLPHTQGESLGLLLPHGRQPDEVEDLADPALRDAVGLREAQQVVVGAAAAVHRLGVQQCTDVLQWLRQVPVVLPVDPDRPAGRIVEVEHHAHGRGLPRPVGAEEAGHHPRSDLEAEVVHGGLRAESFGKSLKLDHAATLERRRAVRHLKQVTYGPDVPVSLPASRNSAY